MPPESVQTSLALALGFAVAGLCSSAYQLATHRLPSLGLSSAGPSAATVAAVPLLMLSAPFLIMRNTLIGRRQEGRRFEFVFLGHADRRFLEPDVGPGRGDEPRGLRTARPNALFQFPSWIAIVAREGAAGTPNDEIDGGAPEISARRPR